MCFKKLHYLTVLKKIYMRELFYVKFFYMLLFHLWNNDRALEVIWRSLPPPPGFAKRWGQDLG